MFSGGGAAFLRSELVSLPPYCCSGLLGTSSTPLPGFRCSVVVVVKCRQPRFAAKEKPQIFFARSFGCAASVHPSLLSRPRPSSNFKNNDMTFDVIFYIQYQNSPILVFSVHLFWPECEGTRVPNGFLSYLLTFSFHIR